MAKCLSKIVCPDCGNHALQPFVNDDQSISGFCFGKCQKYFKDPYQGKAPDVSKIKVKTPEEIQAEINEIKTLPYVPFYRGIKAEFWQKYGVRQSVNQYTGDKFYAIWHPHTRDGKLIAYMAKTTRTKNMWCLGRINDADLYGWEIAKRSGARTLHITEGQEDCISVDMILSLGSEDKKYQGGKHAVTSLPNGVGSVAVLGRQAAEIERYFDDVVLLFDNDEAGREAVRKALIYLPKARIVYLPAKDANKCIEDGLIKEAYKAITFRKANALPATLVRFSDVKGKLNEAAVMGLELPWFTLNNMMRGLHAGLYTLAGGEGLGKTTFVHAMMAHNCNNRIGNLAFMMEETKEETFLNTGNKILGRDTLDPKHPITDSESDAVEGIVDEYTLVYDFEEDRSADAFELKDTIMNIGKSCLDFWEVMFVDNLTKITESIATAAERSDFISTFAAELDTFARRTGKVVIVLSHFNKQAKGTVPYSEGGRGDTNQLAGGAGLARYSNGIWYAERNNQGVDPNCIKFRIGKNRKGRMTGVVKMYYEKETTNISETDWEEELFKIKK